MQDGICILDGIVIVAPGNTTWGWSSGGGASWGDFGTCDGYDASVCDNYEPYDWGNQPDPGPDGTYRPECDRDANGFCVTREFSNDEWDALAVQISNLQTPTAACARAKQILQELHAFGPGSQRLRAWDGYDIYRNGSGQLVQRLGQNLSDVQGRYIEFDSYWAVRDPEVLAHEALHWYLDEIRSPLLGEANEDWVHAEDDKCIGKA